MAPEIPPDITKALTGNTVAKRVFDALPPSHKSEYLVWIEGAKKPETRASRIVSMIDRLTTKEPR